MRLPIFAFLIGIGQSQDLTDIGQLGAGVFGNLPFDSYLLQLGQICEPIDGDLKSAVDGIKDVIRKIDGPLTSLMMTPEFEAFTLIDMMKITEALIKQLDKSWCNQFLSVINNAFAEQTNDMDKIVEQIKDVSREMTGTIMNILRNLGVNAQVGRLIAMAELEKAFVLGNTDLRGLFDDEIWPIVEGIVNSIDLNYKETASPANYAECRVMDEILPWVETAKPLVLGLISDFNDAFRGKEGLLSIGKMVFFEYRLSKHLLFNENACEMLMVGATEIAAEISNVDLTSIVDLGAFSGISGISGISGVSDIAGIFAKAASKNSMTSSMMNLLGDFAKSEIRPNGAQPLTYDMFKMSQIGETAIGAAPNMMNTIKSNAGPIMEKAGMKQDQIKMMMDAINEENVKSFATQMSAELSKSRSEMICAGQSTCAELTSFQALVAKENAEAAVLPGNGSGKTVLSLGATFLTILSLIYA